jgi:enamine deaminase RidA (YjgF/YER057c/UK114 family)
VSDRYAVDVEQLPAFGNYSHAVISGSQVLISGQVSVDAHGEVVGIGDELTQAKTIFGNLETILHASGLGWPDVVFLRAFLVTEAALSAYRTARDSVLDPPYPASTVVFVPRLVDPEWLLEVEAVALRRSS